MPVCIRAHAFGAERPSNDLLVSSGHAVCVNVLGEILVPAAALINGKTIEQADIDSVTYWHVELDAHDILLAENLPVESYLDMGNRGFFVESHTVALGAAPDVVDRTHVDFCRPFHANGPLVEAARTRLDALALDRRELNRSRVSALL